MGRRGIKERWVGGEIDGGSRAAHCYHGHRLWAGGHTLSPPDCHLTQNIYMVLYLEP